MVAGCDGCIASHAQEAVPVGAPKKQPQRHCVTILMHGGPATIFGARAYDAFCEFAEAANSAASGANR
ncbi:putative alkylhydroperoxidase [Mycobacterium xenopi 4042]|uniref:Putative alkylhydroperoxidase n=1 Tax=Mycobacterium xenopi 4042 TaxID=1299334 RepID=X8DY76_MYCXE|nr:putative alkylhydroperoxidase [Mycobacterium xenopi 4042]